jgi:hypothetical protein
METTADGAGLLVLAKIFGEFIQYRALSLVNRSFEHVDDLFRAIR